MPESTELHPGPQPGVSRRAMSHPARELRPGDFVEVKTPDEILATLDSDGAIDHLPFMPEMIQFCGKRFQVSRRVVKTCTSGSRSTMHAFRQDDVVLLDGLRCSGADHDGCPKACMIFWREAWLRKIEDAAAARRADSEGAQRLRARLKTLVGPKTYFCQASELLRATSELSRRERFTRCIREVHSGNCTWFEMTHRIAIWSFWRIRRLLLGPYAAGINERTPMESLGLQPGEWVEVKPLENITNTLNATGHNRGLWFSPDMRLSCGKKLRVEKRIGKLIVDGSGEMRQLQNTVFLEGSLCSCAHVAFGGCSRCEYVYWREIWLRRSNGQNES